MELPGVWINDSPSTSPLLANFSLCQVHGCILGHNTSFTQEISICSFSRLISLSGVYSHFNLKQLLIPSFPLASFHKPQLVIRYFASKVLQMDTLRQGCTTLFIKGVVHPSSKVYYTLTQGCCTRSINLKLVISQLCIYIFEEFGNFVRVGFG